MIDGLFKPKATMDELSDLHNKVAKAISTQLDDPKVLALAVKFLKYNNVVTDMIVSSDFISLTDNINYSNFDEKSNEHISKNGSTIDYSFDTPKYINTFLFNYKTDNDFSWIIKYTYLDLYFVICNIGPKFSSSISAIEFTSII